MAVPAVSDRGAFGGPTSVAVAQTAALGELGVDMQLVGAWCGRRRPAAPLDVPATLFRAYRLVPWTAFSGYVSVGLLRWWRRNAAHTDVLHLHTGRHLTTLLLGAAVRRSGVPYVVQTHGMVPPSKRLDAVVLDKVFVTPLLRGAAAVLTLTEREEQELRAQFGEHVRLVRVSNAVPVAVSAEARSRQVGSPARLLFLGRLHARKRPLDLVVGARLLRERGCDVRVDLVGPDEGERPAVAAAIEGTMRGYVELHNGVVHDEALHWMSAADIFVLPSVDEPFPMAALEAMSVGTPVIVTSSCGIADLLREADAAGIVDPNPESLADEIQRLLADPQLRERRVNNGLKLLRARLSPHSLAEQLVDIYAGAIERGRG